jgi:hypothetical protein
MKPIILNADYMISPEEIPDVSSSTEIHLTRFGNNQFPNGEPSFIDENSYKIFCHVNEPTTSRWVEPVENIIKHHKKYDKIVTSNPEVLDKCSNAKFMVYGTTWLNKSPHHPDSFGKYDEKFETIMKEFSLSMVCGALFGKSGYNIRHNVFLNKDKISYIPLRFYSSTRFPIPNIEQLPNDDKINLFYSMFSVVVESTSEQNYISEKLIDCLITNTIPIYWGCPNASDFFDTSYWISLDQIFNNNFQESYYWDNIEKIKYNAKIAKKYCSNFIQRILDI